MGGNKATKPCPCGFFGDAERECRCSGDQVQRYRARLSGPLLDRIDMSVSVQRVSFAVLSGAAEGASSEEVAVSVVAARKIAMRRQGVANAMLAAPVLQPILANRSLAIALLQKATDKFQLSARVCHRVLRVARTVADLEGSEEIAAKHMGEALALRLGEVGG